MSKKGRISYLRKRIMYDIEKVNILLGIIASHRTETHQESIILAHLILTKTKRIDKNNEKIGRILGC